MKTLFSKEVVRSNAVVSPKKQPQEEKSFTVETRLSVPTEYDMEAMFEVVEEVLIDAAKCDKFVLPQSKFREGTCLPNDKDKRKMAIYPVECKDASIREAPPSKECFYDLGKQLCSSMARDESMASATAYRGIDNVWLNQADNKKQCGIPMTGLSCREHGGLVLNGDASDKVCRHIANVIGQDDSKHVRCSPDKNSLDVVLPCCGGVTATGNGSFKVHAEEMGNMFLKSKDEGRVSPVLKTKFTRAEAKVLPVLAKGLNKDIERVDDKLPADVADCKQSLGPRYGCSERVGCNAENNFNATPITEGVALCERNNLSIVRFDAERKEQSDSLRLRSAGGGSSESKNNPVKNLKRTRSEEDKPEEKDTYSPAECKKRRQASEEERAVKLFDVDDEVVCAKNERIKKKPTKIAPGDAELDLPVETRSSRRLRSRVNNKRGRYESDYVADLPKANKKPKRILPTHEYDNDDFWQFYRDCEKTVYSKNLILLNKYIKILKKNELRSPISEIQSASFSNVVCASSSLPTQARVSFVPDDGLVPFMNRLTKQRKTLPELPQVPEEHCAYCGRSFVGEDKQSFEAHLARHGMRHTMLAAPQMVKKKKKTTKNGRKNFVFKRPKPKNKTVVVVDPPKNKTEDVHTEATCSSATVSDTSNQPGQLGPLPKPSHLSMGHRKQTARKSFSLASTLPKDMLIAALECKMRAQSTIKPDKTQPTPAKPTTGGPPFSPISVTKVSPSKSVSMQCSYSNSPLPKPHSARKTLTGLPITYSHLNRSYIHAITSPTKSTR